VHPYTFRKESPPKNFDTFEDELRTFLSEYDIDAGFTDQPDIMKNVIESLK